MSTTQQTTSASLDLLRRCGGCGYALTGLCETGICPECASPFTNTELVLFGWSAGNLATIETSTPKTTIGLLVFAMLLALIEIDKAIRFARRESFFYAACSVAIILILVLRFWRRFSIGSDFNSNAKLLLSRDGYSQVMSNHKFRPSVWKASDRIEVIRESDLGIRIQVRCKAFVGTTRPIDFLVHSAADVRSWGLEIANATGRGVLVKPAPAHVSGLQL